MVHLNASWYVESPKTLYLKIIHPHTTWPSDCPSSIMFSKTKFYTQYFGSLYKSKCPTNLQNSR